MLHYDNDFDTIATFTEQSTKWIGLRARSEDRTERTGQVALGCTSVPSQPGRQHDRSPLNFAILREDHEVVVAAQRGRDAVILVRGE